MPPGLAVLPSLAPILLAGTLLAYYYPTSSILDRPIHSVVGAFALCAILLFWFGKHLNENNRSKLTQHGASQLSPLENRFGVFSDTKTQSKYHPTPLNERWLSWIAVGSALALTLRIELFRRMHNESECSFRSFEGFLPFLLAVYDALRVQHPLSTTLEERADSSIYESVSIALKRSLLSSKWRYTPSALLFSFGAYLLTMLWDSQQSTYICPLLHGQNLTVRRLQFVSLLLDTMLAIVAQEIALVDGKSDSQIRKPSSLWLAILGIASVIWVVIGLVYAFVQSEERAWVLLGDLTSQTEHIGSWLWLTGLFCATCFTSALRIEQYGVLDTAMILTGTFTVIPGFRFVWSHRRPFPPVSPLALTWSFIILYLSWSLYRNTWKIIEHSRAKTSPFWRICRFMMLCVALFPGLFRNDTVHSHPIDILMYEARNNFLKYVDRAASSRTLEQAVANYVEKYGENPPPRFDVWFDFAKNRSVSITDDFDQIYNDLLPFRAMSPATLREQTYEITANPWNEIAGLVIRNGKTELQDNFLPTHRWMVEGAATIISTFSQYLPDMDLAFNLNDESRIAVAHDEMLRLRHAGEEARFTGSSTFSKAQDGNWKAMPEHATSDTIFENWSFRKTFHEWGIRGCSPVSKAYREPQKASKRNLCTECVAPHSLGQFVSNWSLAADPCHQPDLAHLGGFHLSPAAFKTSRELRPVLSQSKVHGYNDILFPSPWNYMEKARYDPVENHTANENDQQRPAYTDPAFADKENTLFWRGGTSEGVSAGRGTWRGMTRQRLIHMANNLTSNPHDQITLLVPNAKHPEQFTYSTIPGTAPKSLGLSTNMRFVDNIGRCGEPDCTEQALEFGLVPPEDFQAHWKYRYLFDLDGAGFSGRFIPFLQSRSLPFKTALFREWYDSRLTPWLHFVPQDIRLHDVWSTLAYFAGLNGTDHRGRKVEWKPHFKEAEMIAESGRQWAGKVLTKADMEVYFFRLLLEWGRLTDDNRDNLGFVLKK